MDIIRKIERENMRMDIPEFRSGDTIKVHLRIIEGEKQRIQVFQGNVIRDVPSVNLLVYKVSYFVIAAGGGYRQHRQFPVICFCQSWHIVARSCSPSTTDNNRFASLCSHTAGKICRTTFIY